MKTLLLALLLFAGTSPADDLDTTRWAAAAGPERLSWSQLEQALLDKYGWSADGKEALQHLLKARLLEKLAEESRLEVGSADVDAKEAELEAQIRASGQVADLDAFLDENHMSPQTFREFLRLAIVQERLARAALGIPAGRPITGEQQEMWLSEIMKERGVDYPPPPWPDGVAARCGDLEVSVADYRQHLSTKLPEEDMRLACRHLLLARLMRARMPDLTETAVAQAVEAEIERRRGVILQDPTYQGLTYDQVMASRGTLPGALPRDPEILATALARLWVQRKYGEEDLRAEYSQNRELYDGRFGEALKARVLFLNAAVLPNDLVPRSFEQARAQAQALRGSITSREAFIEAVRQKSEDPRTREDDGRYGWVTRSGEAPAVVRTALFEEHPAGIDPERRLVGPVDLPAGVALFWVEDYRPTPDWATMRRWVERELRRRFVEEVLPPGTLVTWLDD